MRLRALTRARHRGFTLVELAIVVVVIGILSVIGGVIYRRQRAISRTSEATSLTAALRASQEAYKTERGVYAAVSNDTSSFYPAATPGAFVTEWGGACTNCVGGDPNGWKKIDFHPTGPVMYGYATVADLGGAIAAGPPPRGMMAAMAAPVAPGGGPLKATDPYYVTVAWGDTDADGKPCIVLSYSTSNQLVVESEGE